MSRLTQKKIMADIVDNLNSLHSWRGWEFKQVKVAGIRHALQGDNKKDDLHLVFTVPMLLLQQALDYESAVEYKVYQPILDLFIKADEDNQRKEAK